MRQIPELAIAKVKRSWCVMAGVAVLGKFRTEDAAKASLEADRELYTYWAGSAGVSIQNTPAKVVHLG